MDDATRKTFDHGQRIRACLKQPQSQPLPVAQQIFVLIALQAGLFDQIPVEKVADGEVALQKALATLPDNVAGRLISQQELSDEDRKSIVTFAKDALANFQPRPGPTPPAKDIR